MRNPTARDDNPNDITERELYDAWLDFAMSKDSRFISLEPRLNEAFRNGFRYGAIYARKLAAIQRRIEQ